MKSLTVRQPYAYLAGVLRGDGWLNSSLCLRVADRDFAETFAATIRNGYGCTAKVNIDERGYFLVRRNSAGRFEHLRTLIPESSEARAAWLRGYFDSEGNAQLTPLPTQGDRSFGRRVSFADLGFATRWSTLKPSKGHIGTLPVHELALRGSKQQYARFAELISSSIARKRIALGQIAESYCEDMSSVRREMQARGVATRIARRNAGGTY